MPVNRLIVGVALLALTGSSVAAQSFPGAQAPSQEPQEVIIDQGVLRPFQIAVANFDGENGAELSSVIRSDLRRSGYFEPLDPASFVETGLTLANAPNFAQWT